MLRQPGLVRISRPGSSVEMLPPFNRPEAFVELAGLLPYLAISSFSTAPLRARQPTVRPPRLGGNRRSGVSPIARRSGPIPSVFRWCGWRGVSTEAGSVLLKVSGLDLRICTPVIDIKPFTSSPTWTASLTLLRVCRTSVRFAVQSPVYIQGVKSAGGVPTAKR